MASAPLTLEHVHNQMKEWRSTKKTGESIPENLWKDIIALAPHYVKSTILKTLGISSKQYNAKYQALTGKQPGKAEASRVPAKSKPASTSKAKTATASKPKTTMSKAKPQATSSSYAKAKPDTKPANTKAASSTPTKAANDYKVVQISAETDKSSGASYRVEIRSTKENLVLTAYLPTNELVPFVQKLFSED
jgi:cell division protein FtsN